jgi:hypothetical protein
MSLTMPAPAVRPETPDSDPGRRGRLVIEPRAARHLVEGVLARTAPNVADSDARVTSLTDDGIELDISVTLDYPTVALSGVLRQLRLDLAEEASRQLGRPVRHIDLMVSKFVAPAKPDARSAPRRVI